MPYKDREGKGVNLYSLVKELGSDPSAEMQAPFEDNLVKALWNLKRLLAANASGDMTKVVYDPTNVAGDAFSMANMVGTTWPSSASAAYALASGANPLLDVAGSGNLVSAADPNVAGDSVIVIPTDAIFDYPDGTWFEIINVDAALDMTLTATAGCFLNGVSGGSIAVPAGNNRIFLYKYTTNSWYANVIYKTDADLLIINAQTGTTYTLVRGDVVKNSVIEIGNANPNVITIPLNATLDLPLYVPLTVLQVDAGLTTLRGEVGVESNGNTEAGGNESDVVSQGQWKAMSIYQKSTDVWRVIGGA